MKKLIGQVFFSVFVANVFFSGGTLMFYAYRYAWFSVTTIPIERVEVMGYLFSASALMCIVVLGAGSEVSIKRDDEFDDEFNEHELV